MLLIITSTGDRLFGFINIDDLERPCTLKILILSDFLAIFGCKRVNCDEMDGDRLRLPANRNCYRLSGVSWALLKLLVSFSINTISHETLHTAWWNLEDFILTTSRILYNIKVKDQDHIIGGLHFCVLLTRYSYAVGPLCHDMSSVRPSVCL